jgi:glycosyltransferase involved in cell wall biosynthesis
VVFPNAMRAKAAFEALGASAERASIVWNVPRRAEMPVASEITQLNGAPLVLYFHGSIGPRRLPETILEAIADYGGAVTLWVAGYEAPDSVGYVESLCRKWNVVGRELIRYLGQIPLHEDLLVQAAQAHVGLALMPMQSSDLNMLHMAGASNKPFDYMAAGLPLIVSDLPEWREMFVNSGFGRACNPGSSRSLADAIRAYFDAPKERAAMGIRCQQKIREEWCYEVLGAELIALGEGAV